MRWRKYPATWGRWPVSGSTAARMKRGAPESVSTGESGGQWWQRESRAEREEVATSGTPQRYDCAIAE
eukprot:4591452-Pleurochrysis_carterae.AAC.2